MVIAGEGQSAAPAAWDALELKQPISAPLCGAGMARPSHLCTHQSSDWAVWAGCDP